ncbi:choice-of-anchor L domain-containing protein [Sessilibacter corallicola]|uniref:choice-of-anchor L domain-containing protein n=1 Tax=Sessilibacter corallicola TaxID=2904075 RepID=UPI001E2C68C8|nr:choice-of-anchor L domain-containing protein [Sessilibacter corallicola]
MKFDKTQKAIYIALGLVLASDVYSFSLEVEDSVSANTLASNVFGSGVSVFNANFIGEDVQAGIFDDSNRAISDDFRSGIVLSTGLASDAEREGNFRDYNTTEFGNAGSESLSDLAGAPTFDAATLSFDFQLDNNVGGDLVFEVIFASEEYTPSFFLPDFPSFINNDIFSFSIDGVDQAFLPGGDTISVASINRTRNIDLFLPNDRDEGLSAITEANGITEVITFNISGLEAGVHTAEFSIADAVNDDGDSWVFFSGFAFGDEVEPVAVPELSARGASLAVIFLISILLLMSEKSNKIPRQVIRLA